MSFQIRPLIKASRSALLFALGPKLARCMIACPLSRTVHILLNGLARIGPSPRRGVHLSSSPLLKSWFVSLCRSTKWTSGLAVRFCHRANSLKMRAKNQSILRERSCRIVWGLEHTTKNASVCPFPNCTWSVTCGLEISKFNSCLRPISGRFKLP